MTTIRTLFLLTMVMVVAACQTPAASGTTPTMDTTALEARVAALETQLADQQKPDHSDDGAQHGDIGMENQSQTFAVTTALYMMDTAGFHGIDESLNTGDAINPVYARTIQRVARLVSVTPWPAELANQATTLLGTLNEFSAALSNDDAEAAKPLATLAHDQEHELSHAASEWINAQLGIEGEGEHGD